LRSRPGLETLEDRRLLATSVATFEDLGLAPNSFNNNAGPSGQFVDGDSTFKNTYSSAFGGIWSGWAISSMKDTTTPGFTNPYSAIAGSGAGGSSTYAVGFPFDAAADSLHPADSFVNLAAGASPVSIQVTNTTYAYLSMLNGDSFEKAFSAGDFFLLTIAGYKGPDGTGTKVGEVDEYLADFRGSSARIVNTWQTLDLTSLAGAASLQFGLESSMNDPTFGMNTPAFFAADNLTVTTGAGSGGTVSGVVFNDVNGDGVQGAGEGGLPNWAVQLSNGSTVVATSGPTDSNGNYTISGVAPGTYTLREVLQGGYTQTAPASPGTYSVTVTAGGTVAGKNFGDHASAPTGDPGGPVSTAPTLVSIVITPSSPSLATGLTQQFKATGTYSDQTTQNLTGLVTWASASPSVATITRAGLATGQAAGSSTITATLNGVTVSTVLTVPGVAATATATVSTSSVTITSFRVERARIGTQARGKKPHVLIVRFSGPLDAAAAQNLAAYTDLAGKVRKNHKVSEIVYGALVPLSRAIYDPSANSVILVPRGRPRLSRLEQLQVNVSLLTDRQGQPINNGEDLRVTAS
jgi:hypothetical protein